MIISKRSQAATEFLVTYGWVILGVMVVVGSLAYFGIFNTDRYINDECNFGTQLYCEDFKINTSGHLSLSMRNNFGKDIQFVQSEWNYGEQHIVRAGSSYYNPVINNVVAGTLATTTIRLDTPFSRGEKVRLKGVITFRRSATAPSHNITGTIVATVQ